MMFNTWYDIRYCDDILIFESKNKKYVFKLDEIHKIRIFPIVGVYRSISAICIYGKKKKITLGIKSVDEYESVVKKIHLLLIGKGQIEYIKGSNALRLGLIFILPFFVVLAYLIIRSRIEGFKKGYSFPYHSIFSTSCVFLILYNFPKNFKDSKVETYDPEIIIRFGPRIFFDRSYLEKVVREEDLN